MIAAVARERGAIASASFRAGLPGALRVYAAPRSCSGFRREHPPELAMPRLPVHHAAFDITPSDDEESPPFHAVFATMSVAMLLIRYFRHCRFCAADAARLYRRFFIVCWLRHNVAAARIYC